MLNVGVPEGPQFKGYKIYVIQNRGVQPITIRSDASAG